MSDSVFTTSFIQRHHFPSPPPRQVRQQLIALGYVFDGHAWTRTISTASALSASEALYFIARDYADFSRSGIAPTHVVG